MAKLIQTETVYVWPKDSESGEITYSVYTDDEYNEECIEYGVDTLNGLQFDSAGDVVDEIEASEDSYSSQGHSLNVVNIHDENYNEVNDLVNLYNETRDKINKIFNKSKNV